MAISRRTALGVAVAVALVVMLSAGMIPVRGHLSVATAGLVLVVPVVAGVVVGGLTAGIVAVVAGFVAYDVLFIPPYGTLAVGRVQNWAALAVYVIVLVLVAAVVTDQRRARDAATRREREARRLFELSEALVADSPHLAQRVVDTVARTFEARWVALMLPEQGDLATVAQSGEVPPHRLASLLGTAGTDLGLAVPLLPAVGSPETPAVVALVTEENPVGLLAVAPAPGNEHDRQLLATFANQAALAITRADLREAAVRAERLEAAEETRQILLRTVSHDLRTPLATIKASLSELLEPGSELAEPTRRLLLGLAEEQADRLDRLVANLLDVTRVEAGSLAVRTDAAAVDEIVDEAMATLGRPPVTVDIAADVPLVQADHTLICHVLVNLVDNALRYSPDHVEVSAVRADTGVELAVTDHGPGLAADQRARVGAGPGSGIDPVHGTGGRGTSPVWGQGHGGLGLAIANAFVAAHGSRLTVTDNAGHGSRLAFILAGVPMHGDVDRGHGSAAGTRVSGASGPDVGPTVGADIPVGPVGPDIPVGAETA